MTLQPQGTDPYDLVQVFIFSSAHEWSMYGPSFRISGNLSLYSL